MSDTSDPAAISGWATPDWSTEPPPSASDGSTGWAPLGPAPEEPAAVAPPAAALVGGATTVHSPERPSGTPGSGPSFGRRRAIVGAAVVALVGLVAFLALGRGGVDPGPIIDRFAVELEGRGLPAEGARCVAEHVVDDLGTKDLRHVEDFGSAEPPPGLSEDFPERFGSAASEAFGACDVALPAG